MLPSVLLTTILAGFSTALVSPILRDEAPAGFSLAAEKAPDVKPDFVREWAAAHQKWGKGIPPHVSAKFSLVDDDGVVHVDPIGRDSIYIAKIQVGNPPQTLKLALDTGSSDLWVQSSDTRYSYKDDPHAPQYQPNASKTSRRIDDAEWEVQYGKSLDGTAAKGIVYLDTLRMGNFELNDTAIQSAREIAYRFEREPSLSGILGLAKSLPSNIRPPTPTLLDKLRPLLQKPVFAVDLNRNVSGRFDFGHVNYSRATDNITWVKTDSKSPHWDVTFDLTAWKGSHDTWWFHSFEATIDTGTSLMFLPSQLAGMYWEDVPDMRVDPRLGEAYTFPCHFAKNLPDLMLKLPGTEHILTIPGPYLNYGTVEGDDEYCWGGMQNSDGLDVTIFGDIFLKSLYVAFDLETHKVGFANKKHDDIAV